MIGLLFHPGVTKRSAGPTAGSGAALELPRPQGASRPALEGTRNAVSANRPRVAAGLIQSAATTVFTPCMAPVHVALTKALDVQPVLEVTVVDRTRAPTASKDHFATADR